MYKYMHMVCMCILCSFERAELTSSYPPLDSEERLGAAVFAKLAQGSHFEPMLESDIHLYENPTKLDMTAPGDPKGSKGSPKNTIGGKGQFEGRRQMHSKVSKRTQGPRYVLDVLD